ncbi:probable Rotein of unknown function localised to mitochondria [Phialocephala subalpina]|jgi:autophagy-related protein 33|uniref:Autophagy-related protein 33 n=1 Tax=Phialocephala subalpina TaxID=576137 RepID=A0A1L7WD34_9HELO|nr:probable Rotein of unknown function localised to mitochondria [Phialocephala subalpina]
MAGRTVSTLKFVGSISLGLLTGLSYTLSSLTVPTLLTLPSATSASKAFSNLTTISLTHLRTLAAVSSSSFFVAYLLSPRSQKHPYLLWTSLFVAAAGVTDLVVPTTKKTIAKAPKQKKTKSRQMDSSYEVLGSSDRESEMSGEDMDDDVNGEEVREEMEGFMLTQVIRTAIAGVGFAMSVVGIWGDGAADMVIIEM